MDRVSNFGFVLNSAGRLLSLRFDSLAREHSMSMSMPECKALYLLARHEGISQIRLAELSEIDPTSLVRILDRMERNGWIQRRHDKADRRIRKLYVTAMAKPILKKIDIMSTRVRAWALFGLSEEECTQLMDLLERMHENLVTSKVDVKTRRAWKSDPGGTSDKPVPIKPS